MAIVLEPILFANYTSNTPSELADKIGLSFADFDTGEDRFTQAIASARSEILFRLGQFDSNSYPQTSPTDATKLTAAQALAQTAEWHRAGSILYRHKSQLELQFAESGNPLATPDGFNIGAFTPENNVQASEYVRRGNELQSEFDKIMTMIMPNTNMPFVASASGRSSITSDRTFWGKDEWAI